MNQATILGTNKSPQRIGDSYVLFCLNHEFHLESIMGTVVIVTNNRSQRESQNLL